MFIKYFIVICVAAVVASCGSGGSDHSKTGKDSSAAVLSDKDRIADPAFNTVDQLELLYFKDPGGDSLRYTRFYTFLATKDTGFISLLKDNLSRTATKQDSVKACRSEGKIFAFKGEQPVKTIYFSTRCDTCCYLYYISNGAFMYLSLSAELREAINANKQHSREPEATGVQLPE